MLNGKKICGVPQNEDEITPGFISMTNVDVSTGECPYNASPCPYNVNKDSKNRICILDSAINITSYNKQQILERNCPITSLKIVARSENPSSYESSVSYTDTMKIVYSKKANSRPLA